MSNHNVVCLKLTTSTVIEKKIVFFKVQPQKRKVMRKKEKEQFLLSQESQVFIPNQARLNEPQDNSSAQGACRVLLLCPCPVR